MSGKRNIFYPFFVWALSALFILWPFLYVNIQVNDDAYVYFNYAKHLARGELFSFDARGIPSEGFTSVVYLLLLVPAELLGISMPFAASLINIGALLASAWVISVISKKLFPQRKDSAWIVGCLFLFFTFKDKELLQLVGRGFESIVNVLCFFVCLNWLIDVFQKKSPGKFLLVLVGVFCSVLIRPENALLLLPVVLVSFWHLRSNRRTWFYVALVLAGLLFIGGLKWLIFGDVVPTGFYRKVSGGQAGLEYLASYFENYGFWLLASGLFLMVLLAKTEKNKNALKWFLILGICSILSLSFVCWVNPLVGYHFRYLILVTTACYFLITLGIWRFVLQASALGEVSIGVALVMLFFGGPQKYRSDPRHLYNESLAQDEGHPYVRIAKYFQSEVKTPQSITVLFGDAGAIPYYFDCKFIDINGLTEPFLAKMFKEKKDRAIKVSDYTKGQSVDLAVLAVENSSMHPKKKDSQFLPHGPLNDPKEYRYWLKRQKEDGFVYAGTVFGESYDLHFGLRRNSPHFDELDSVLSKYIRLGNGRFLSSDFIVEFSDGNIIFENIHKG